MPITFEGQQEGPSNFQSLCIAMWVTKKSTIIIFCDVTQGQRSNVQVLTVFCAAKAFEPLMLKK